MYALAPGATRLLTTDYFVDSGSISMYALSPIANRLPITDYRPPIPHTYFFLVAKRRTAMPLAVMSQLTG